MSKGGGKAEDWLIRFTKQIRRKLPRGRYILTHARKSRMTDYPTATRADHDLVL